MKKWLLWLIPVLLIAVAYLVPVPQKHALALYRLPYGQPIKGLIDFRSLPTKSIQAVGHDWTYLTLGKGPKTILFLHGMTGSYDFWWQQMMAFGSTYQVISVTYPPIDNLAELGQGIMAILDKEHVDKTVVVGSSLGGYLTQYLLATYPQRVEKAVLGNTFPQNDIYEQQNKTRVTLATWLPEWAVMGALRKNLEEKVIPASETNPLAEAMLLENGYGRMSKAQFLARYYCVIDKFKPVDNQTKNVPLLIFESDNDPLILPELRTKLKQLYPTAQVHTFHQKGHFPYLNDPTEYNAVLGEFLAK